MKSRLFFAFILSPLLLLAGCGGGGDTGGSQGNFTLSTTQLSFEADYQGALPAAKTIQVSWSDPDIAGFACVFSNANPQPAWLDFSQVVSGSPADLTFSINTTNLAPGTYTATLPLYSGDISLNPLAHQDITVTYTVGDRLSVTPASLDFNHVIGVTSIPPSQNLTLGGQVVNWSVSTTASWVTLGSSSGTAPGSLSVAVDPSGLATGDYLGVIRLTDTTNNRLVEVGVNLTVTEPALAVGQASLAFSGVNGADIPVQTLSLAINHGGAESWAASNDQGWLILNKTSGTTPDSLQVSIDPSIGPLASGSYTGTITLSATSGDYNLNASVPVTLDLTAATLTLNPATVTLGGTDGVDESPQDFTIALDAGGNAYPWSAQLTEIDGTGWLSADKTSGNASATADLVRLTTDRAAVVGGTYQGSIAVTAVVNGDTIEQTLPVVFNREARRLFIADNGVALVSTPGISRLSRSLVVNDTLSKDTPWSAVSNQTWLTVSPSGMSGDNLVLTADPGGLTADQLHLASVTVSSTEPTIENTETVRVGLWLGSGDPKAMDSLAIAYSRIQADPIRPYLYAHNEATDIDIYNVYTGTLVSTVSNAATQLGEMTISRDGSTLYVMDSSNQTLVPLDLDNYTSATPWSITGNSSNPRLTYSRVTANDFVIASNGRSYAAIDGVEESAAFGSGNALATSRDGDTLCGVNIGISPYTLFCYRMHYTALNSGLLELTDNASFRASDSVVVASNGRDIAVSADGGRVYVASGAPYSFIGYDYDGSTISRAQILAAQAYPNIVEISDDDLLYGGASNWYGDHSNAEDDVWVYDMASETALYSNYVSGRAEHLLDRQLSVSGDGVRAMMLTSDPKLIFLTAP